MSLLTRFEKSIDERGETLKVGLVGAGQMGQGIVTQLSKSKGIELSLIIDKNQNKLEKALEKCQNIKVKPTLSQTILIFHHCFLVYKYYLKSHRLHLDHAFHQYRS